MIFVHLYNDSSGSPRVLKSVIESMVADGEDVVLFLGSAGDGLLGRLPINIQRFFYPKFSNKIAVLLAYGLSQFLLFFTLMFSATVRNHDTIYVNTVLPFGAALYGKLFNKRVIYHIHEVGLSPPILFTVLMWLADRLADMQIYVSKTQQGMVKSKHPHQVVLYNSVSDNIYSAAQQSKGANAAIFTVFMPASLRTYKGIDVFVRLCEHFSGQAIQWILLLNDEPQNVAQYRDKNKHLSNLVVLDRVEDPSNLYLQANLVLNLSLVDQWVETFGLTIIEAFCFGLPVIAPPVGGPTEIVQDGVNGFLIDSYDFDVLAEKIQLLFVNQVLYGQLSANALIAADKYTPRAFAKALKEIISVR